LHAVWSVSNSKHEAHTGVAVALYPHAPPVSERHEEQPVCVEHTDVVDVVTTGHVSELSSWQYPPPIT